MESIRTGEKGLWLCIAALGCSALLAQSVLALRGAENRPETVPDAASPAPVRAAAESPALDPRRVTEALIDAIVQVESAENPRSIGRAGERGLMQIKCATWREVTARLLGGSVSFDRAFDPELNRRVGKAYLAHLQDFLHSRRSAWRSDERSLLLACYNAGPRRVRQAGFDLRRLPRPTRQYVERVTALHELYLAEDAPRVRDVLLSQREGVERPVSG